ncbi:MAG: cation transporter [Bacteroidaceae bacterium]|nr:cation transporter [Bacteroidaceae bacterium]
MAQEKTEEHQHHHHHHHRSKKAKPQAKGTFSLMLNIGICLNIIYLVVAFAAGYIASSIGLISDALFTVANVLAITVALFIHRMNAGHDKPSKSYAYRYRSIYLRLVSIVLMLTSAGALAFEAVRRMNLPIELDESLPLPDGGMMLRVAVIGIVLHAVTAFLLTRERKHNSVAGTPTAFWLSTALSLVTAIGGVIVMQVEDDLFDNVAAFFGAALMLVEGIILLYPVLRYAMGGATDGINRDYVTTVFKTHGNVRGFGHMHIMTVNRTEMALMAHISLFHPEQADVTKHEIRSALYKLGLKHVTLEVSTDKQESEG